MKPLRNWFRSIVRAHRRSGSSRGRGSLAARSLSCESLEDRRLLAALVFSPASEYAVGSGPEQVIAADFNKDGFADLVVVNGGSGDLSILINKGDGTFHAAATYELAPDSSDFFPSGIIASDLNRDGYLDLAVASHSAAISVLLGSGSGTFGPATILSFPVEDSSYNVVAADLDGDGAPDLAAVGISTGDVWVFTNDGTGGFGPASSYATGYGGQFLVAADFNGDGKADLATAGSGVISVLLNDGSGGFTISTYASPTSSWVRTLIAADLSGDGRADLVAVNFGEALSVILNNGDGTFAAVADYTVGQATYWGLAKDLNGDGKIDLAACNLYGGVSILLNNGDGTFAAAVTYTVGSSANPLLAADLDGDGDQDLATTDGYNNVIALLQNNGDGTFAVGSTHAVGDFPNWVVAADLNNDGKPDLIASNIWSSSVSVLINQTEFPPSDPPQPPPPENPWDKLIDDFHSLGANGSLNPGQVNSLVSKVEAIKASLAAGKTKTAINQINALRNQIVALVKARKLDGATGNRLIGELDALRTVLAQSLPPNKPAKGGKKRK